MRVFQTLGEELQLETGDNVVRSERYGLKRDHRADAERREPRSSQSTEHAVVSTTVTPGAWLPVSSAFAPTSFVPIHNAYTVSRGCSVPSEPLACAAKYVGKMGFEEGREGAGGEGVGARRADLSEGEEGEVAVLGGEHEPHRPPVVVAVLVNESVAGVAEGDQVLDLAGLGPGTVASKGRKCKTFREDDGDESVLSTTMASIRKV
ncbi:hypothetical protein GSI_15681 [Ganoderma sinense ZZ0214-1]|uniref:Uncharacterized protein n=1 Tax=Ganoderma sinense ZZ0214-1 TaxID=1077348 RepID=A0A2G8RN92_9APHY|nr:hypothetical protein GSI_15681 [Ganoderma sinense ZZ0214-1]